MDYAPTVRPVVLELLRPLLSGQTIFLVGPAAGSRTMARFFKDVGARSVPVDLGPVPKETRDRFLAFEQLLRWPGEAVRAELDAEDPSCAALVYAGSFTTATHLCGRRIIARRSDEHLAAERKDRQRELLGPRGEIIDLAEKEINVGWPVVIQGIPRDGVAMATSHTYFAPASVDRHRLQALTDGLKRDCAHAVVSNFDQGTPCTYYGFVTSDGIVDFGPVEALVYWNPATLRIHAPGVVRPIGATQEGMNSAREEVHRLAIRLNQRIGYVGAFGTDGVLQGSHHTIHEINPRVCAGFSLLDKLVPHEAPLAAVDLAVREFPDMSARLLGPLRSLACVLQEVRRPAHMLWEGSPVHWRAPAAARKQADWTSLVRRVAANGLPALGALKGDGTCE